MHLWSHVVGPTFIGTAGVGVRKIFHKLQLQAIKPFDSSLETFLAWRMEMSVKSLERLKWLVLG
jgi:hypothetical protein